MKEKIMFSCYKWVFDIPVPGHWVEQSFSTIKKKIQKYLHYNSPQIVALLRLYPLSQMLQILPVYPMEQLQV